MINEDWLSGDFMIDNGRRTLWIAELNILKKLLEVAEKYDILIYPFYGTLLGAVRHGGFIPWDDDLDVAITREDYIRLCSIADKEFGYPFFFQNAMTDQNYYFQYARLRRTDMTGIVLEFSEHIYNNGLFIDIFVLDNVCGLKSAERIWKKSRKLTSILRNYHFLVSKKWFVKLFKPYFWFMSKINSYDYYYNKLVKIYSSDSLKCKGKFLCSFSSKKASREIFESAGFEITSEVIFENIILKAPSNYQAILTSLYGDYMTPPNIKERGIWHEGIAIFDASISFLNYYKKNYKQFSKALNEYEKK